MYVLYKERWYLDNTVEQKHEVEKENCSTIDIARENMLYDYDRIAGDFDKLLLKNSFIALRYTNGRCSMMIQYGILRSIEEA